MPECSDLLVVPSFLLMSRESLVSVKEKPDRKKKKYTIKY